MPKVLKVERAETTVTVEFTEAEIVGLVKTIGASSPAQRESEMGCTQKEGQAVSSVYQHLYSTLSQENIYKV